MSFKYVCVFRFSDAIYPLLLGTSDGTVYLALKLDIPIDNRFTISNTVRSSTNLNLSSGSIVSELSLDCERYSMSPKKPP